MTRRKDVNWNVGEPDTFGRNTWDQIKVSILLDLRDEMKRNNDLLQRMVDVLECRNTLTIPHTLKRIDKRLAKSHPLK